MRNLNGFKLGAAMILLSSTVNAAVVINNQQIPDEDILGISITPGTATLNINTRVPYTVTRSSDPVEPPSTMAISSFYATPTTFVEGGSTTLRWVTANAVSCEPTSGSWVGRSISANGSSSVQINAPGSYGFTVRCKDASNATVSRNLVVTVTAAPVVGGNQCPASPLSGESTTWANLWVATFPLPSAGQALDTVPSRGYVAYKFNTGSVVNSGSLASVGVTYTSGSRRGSVSECPGDFKVSSACSASWGIGGGITWSTKGMAGACELKPNTDYYFNITFTDGTDPASATCSGYCGIKLQHTISR